MSKTTKCLRDTLWGISEIYVALMSQTYSERRNTGRKGERQRVGGDDQNIKRYNSVFSCSQISPSLYNNVNIYDLHSV